MVDSVWDGNEEVAVTLLDVGRKHKTLDIWHKDEGGKTLLMVAVEAKCEKVALMLLENGAEINAHDDLDRTALSLALERGQVSVVRAIQKKQQELGKAKSCEVPDFLGFGGSGQSHADIEFEVPAFLGAFGGSETSLNHIGSLFEEAADVDVKDI